MARHSNMANQISFSSRAFHLLCSALVFEDVNDEWLMTALGRFPLSTINSQPTAF